MQDALAIAIALAASCWLAWSLGRRLFASSCRPSDPPPGNDGFVPLDHLRRPAKRPDESG